MNGRSGPPCLLAVASLLFASLAAPVSAQETQDTLYSYTERDGTPLVLWDGAYGPVARLQTRLAELLSPSDPAFAGAIGADGKFGPNTARAIRLVQHLPDYAAFAADSPENGARVSVAFWRALFGEAPLPNMHERAMALVLTYEATPFGRVAEWNFCQRPVQGGTRRTEPCRTNDDSLITWGPRGATIGGGREVQAVLIETERRQPGIVREAFGTEYDALQRLLALSTEGAGRPSTPRLRGEVSDAELFLCPIWLDPARATAWAAALARVSEHAATQAAYEAVYNSQYYDGAKVRGFMSLYRELGVTASEIDYAFFLDRATHTRGVFASGHNSNTAGAIRARAAQIRESLAGIEAPANWQYRLAIARLMPTASQRDDRNGRDMAFIIDGAGEGGLTASERANWQSRFGLRASMVGLSDDRAANYAPDATSFPNSIAGAGLNEAERSLCPDWVVQRQKLER